MGIRHRRMVRPRPIIGAIIAGFILTTTFLVIYIFLSRQAIIVPSNHTYQSLTNEQKKEVIERLDRELGRGNYNIHVPRSLDGIAEFMRIFDFNLNSKRKNENKKSVDKLYDSVKNDNGELQVPVEKAYVDPTTRKSTIGFSRIYVIAQQDKKEQRKYLQKFANQNKLTFDFMRVFKDSKEQAANADEKEKLALANVLATHVMVWQQIVDSYHGDSDGFLVLSDDSVLDYNFVSSGKWKGMAARLFGSNTEHHQTARKSPGGGPVTNPKKSSQGQNLWSLILFSNDPTLANDPAYTSAASPKILDIASFNTDSPPISSALAKIPTYAINISGARALLALHESQRSNEFASLDQLLNYAIKDSFISPSILISDFIKNS
ncbi:hypothetical protein AYI69_g3002 [Smittium culicis]|uniref:Uncharacterized protein n=1 Tax=Smittium culicis TaxID=133412 RepID=A0A1R1YKY0_9FUNG|nr:hypothetical protein AYI69_g3002 [Smittium culicis]